VSEAYKDRKGWARKALMNIAMSGPFSSDRTIEQYNTEIWKSQPVIAPNCPLHRSIMGCDDECL
jgi:starch phosphorylase